MDAVVKSHMNKKRMHNFKAMPAKSFMGKVFAAVALLWRLNLSPAFALALLLLLYIVLRL